MKIKFKTKWIIFYGILIPFLILSKSFALCSSTEETNYVNVLKGAFNVRKGNAVYKIPISVPPGTKGMKPRLAVIYSSQGDNGLMGMGARLDGLSVIQRTPATMAQDGFRGSINYDANDRFSLDGQRLIKVEGEYGGDGTIYHTEIERWKKIISYGTYENGSGPLKFKVITKKGHEMEYGYTEDSRVAASNEKGIRVWALNKVKDLNGNYMEFVYKQDKENGSYYPLQINYTGNSNSDVNPQRTVKFDYKNRTDAVPTYQGGGMIKNTMRLVKISTYVGDTPVLIYKFKYQDGNTTGRSQLVSIIQCDASGKESTPTVLSWQQGDPDLVSPGESLSTVIDVSEIYPMDVDGNGLIDLVSIQSSNERPFSIQSFLSDGKELNQQYLQEIADMEREGQIFPADVNGDGMVDLIYGINNGIDKWKVYVFISNGSRFDSPFTYTPPDDVSSTNGHISAADINGDSKTDLVYVIYPDYNSNKLTFSTFLSECDTDTFVYKQTQQIDVPDQQKTGELLSLDMNGDNMLDFVYSTTNGNATDQLLITLLISDGETFTIKPMQSFPFYGGSDGALIPADVNGDSLTDLVYAGRGDSNDTLFLATYSSNGVNFEQGINYIGQKAQSIDSGTLLPMDVNGDRMTDLVFVTTDNMAPYLMTAYLSVGSTFSDPPKTLTNTSGEIGGFPIPTDFNGDAKTDILYVITREANPYPQFHFTKYMAKGDYPDLVNKIDNGIGGQTMISYKPLTDPTVYSKKESDSTYSLPACSLINKISGATFQIGQTDPSVVTGASFPATTVQFPVYAVADYTKNDGRGNSYQYNYYYSNAKIDHNGRGWLGFETILKKDISAGIDKMAAFWQAFPFIGRIKYIQTQCGEGCKDTNCSSKRILSRQNFTYLCQPGSSCDDQCQWSDIYQPYPSVYQVRLQKHIKGYYDYDTYKFSTAQAFTYDRYGNLILYSNYNYSDQQGNDKDTSDNSYIIRKYANYEEDGKYALGYLLASLVTTNDDVSRISDISCGEKPGFNEDTDFKLRTYSYDERMNKTCRCSWDNGEEKQVWLTYSYEYDDFGHKIKITDPDGNTTTVTYETTYHTFPDKKTTPPNQNGEYLTYYYGFDPRFGIRVASTDPNDNTNITVLDDLGRTIANQGPVPDDPPGITPSENNVSSWVTGSYEFSRAKVVTLSTYNYSINDSNNMFIEEQVLQKWPVNGSSGETSWNRKYYDGLGRNYKIVTSGGECEGKGDITIDYTFDAAGNITEQTLPYFQGDTSYSIKNIFNAYNQMIRSTSPAGEQGDETSVTTSDYQWDSDGFTVIVTQAAEDKYKYVKKMKYQYFNSRAKVVSMVIPGDNDATTTYDYDVLARAISATDPPTDSNPKGLTSTVSYDSMGRKHQIYNPHHGAISFTFDKEGKLYKKTDSNGTTTFSYDRLGRITTRLLADNSKVVYAYDDPKAANSKGKKSNISVSSSDGRVEAGYDLQYNKYGKISQMSLSIDGEPGPFVTGFLHDPSGRVYNYTYPDGNVLEKVYTSCYLKELNMNGQNYVTYSNYNALGAPTNITYGNCVNTQHTYNPTGKLLGYLIQDPAGQTLQHDSLTWNHLDLVTKITDRDGFGTDYSQTFEYENFRLIKASSGDTYGTLDYDYDESGNMIFKDGVTYTYSKHQVIKGTKNGTTIFSSAYDDMGNMKTMTLNSITYDYEYNPENRLTKVTRGDNNGNTSFQYNHMGRRIKKVSPDGTKTIYVSPNYQVTTFPDNSSQTTKYITGIHGKIASIRTGTAAPGVSLLYLHQNQVASTVLTTDSAGAVSNRLFYLPYGKLYQPIEKDDFRPKYTGKEYDSNTDLYYYGARYYKPEIGRFITSDNGLGGAKIQQDAFNRYEYVLGNPIIYNDPTGHSAICGGIAGLSGSVFGVATGYLAIHATYKDINDIPLSVGLGVVTGIAGLGVTGGVNNRCSWLMKKIQIRRNRISPTDPTDEDRALARGYELGRESRNEEVNGLTRERDKYRGERDDLQRQLDDYKNNNKKSNPEEKPGGCETPCFTAGTQIRTQSGYVAIEKVKAGDWVWSYNEKTQQPELMPVIQCFKRTSNKLIVLIVNGSTIKTTPEHPFYIKNQGWQKAKNLEIGDFLANKNNKNTRVEKIDHMKGNFTVFNFTVDQNHTYYVSDFEILVHNECGPGGEDGLGDSTEMGSGDMAESSVDASSEIGAEVGAEMETEVGTEIGVEAGAEVGAEIGADVGLEVGTEIAVDTLLPLLVLL